MTFGVDEIERIELGRRQMKTRALEGALIGAAAGTWAAGQFRLPPIVPFQIGGQSFPIVWATIGAFFVASVVGMLGKQSRRR